MTESIGRQYETAIPSLSDTANIQEAFRIYHYGKPTTEFNPTNDEPSDLEPKSIAYYLNDFQNQIDDLETLPTAYDKRGNFVVAGDDGPIILELNPDYPTTFSENGLLLVSDDTAPSGMKWLAPSITLTNIQTIANKKLTNTTILSDGLKFDDSAALHTTTLKSPAQAASKTVFFPTSASVMPGATTTLVGADTTQTLTNKTITNLSAASTIQDGGDIVGTSATQTLTNKTLTSPTITSATLSTSTVNGGGAVVGTTATQTLTNKTISLEAADNTITGRLASTNGGIPAGVISQYAGTAAPDGYLLCQGQSLSTTTFAGLFAAIGYNYGGSGASFNLPNLQNRVPVGKGAGTFASLNATGGAETHTLTTAQIPSHTHTGTTGNQSADHTHTGTTASGGAAHTHSITQQTTHTHSYYKGNQVLVNNGTATGVQSRTNDATLGNLSSTVGAGLHDHGGSTGGASATGHTHTVTTGGVSANHTHDFTTAARGGSEAHNNLQPYIVVNYIIKT